MNIQQIMSKDIIWVGADEPVEKAAQLMRQNNIGSIPVCQGDRVIGMVTDRDITVREVATNQDQQRSVASVMTSNPVTGTPDMDVQQAAKLMGENQIRRLPIVEGGRLVGIVSLGDISTQTSFKQPAGEALNDISQPSDGPM